MRRLPDSVTNTQFALAVHALTLLATREAPQTSEQLARSAASNPVHMRRVLGRLRTAGLVSSRPGAGGGWQLAADPVRTTLAEVWRATHGDGAVIGLHEAAPNCTQGQQIQRSLAAVDRRAARAIEAELAATTLADLAATAPVPAA